jgi:hypothetical protein
MRPSLFAFALVAVGLTGCPDAPCSPSSCPLGCCDANGECQTGTLRVACGSKGGSCTRCEGTKVCTNQVCGAPPVVDAGTDAGTSCRCANGCCLADGSCTANNLNESCGQLGSFCVACGVGQRCENTACVTRACTGCLDPMGACRPGIDDAACGTRGALCVACSPTERCTASQCLGSGCSPSTCPNGCCSGSSCITSNTANCGVGGSICMACTGGKSCVGGVCL